MEDSGLPNILQTYFGKSAVGVTYDTSCATHHTINATGVSTLETENHRVGMDRQEFKDPGISHLVWKYAASIYLPKHHCVLYRNDELGVQKQVMTRRNTLLFPPKEKEYFFIDGISTVFRTEEKMLAALVQLRRFPLPRTRRNGEPASAQFPRRKAASDAI
jgi:hypothetical protein